MVRRPQPQGLPGALPGVSGKVIRGHPQNGSQESNLRRTFSVMRDTLLW